MTQAFPLQWPKGRPRTKERRKSPYSVSAGKAYAELERELRLFNVSHPVVSTNVPLGSHGAPYADMLNDKIQDPGIAVYFTRRKRQIVIACDTFQRPFENVRAVGLAIEGLRALERNGVEQILDQIFEGFAALPSPDMVSGAPDSAWWVILGVSSDATAAEIRAAYKDRARSEGGTSAELNAARDAGLAARQAG